MIDDFFESRAEFINLCEASGGQVSAIPLKARGPGGEPLSITIAQFGAAEPKTALVVLSSTHGVEGPAGAAIQNHFLKEALCVEQCSDTTGILLVHGVNPFGWAWGRRQNENNVDLNRNFVDFDAPLPESPDYDRLNALLNPEVMNASAVENLRQETHKLASQHGAAWLQKTIIEGQYSFPKGLNFGGIHPQDTNVALRSVFSRYLKNCTNGLIIDLHTGLGSFAEATVLSGEGVDTPGHDWLINNFSGFHIEGLYGNAAGEMTPTKGKLARALADYAPHGGVRSFTLEFGAYPTERTFLAGYKENWLYHFGDRKSAEGQGIVAEMREVYCPENTEWRERVVATGVRCVATAWGALNQ